MSYFSFFKIINIFIIIIIIRNFNKRKLTRRPKDIFFFNRTFIESHRGMNREVFQNTLESFRRAIYYNIETIETDVWLTKDRIPVLHHGRGDKGEVFGYYNLSGNITDLTWEKLSTKRTLVNNLKMAKLSDVMKLAKDKIFINLEIKDPRINLTFHSIIKLIEKYDLFEQISLSSFNHAYYYKVREYNKKNNKSLVFGFIYRKNNTERFDYTKKGNSLNIYWKEATKEVCRKAHKNGMAVLVWFDMDEEENEKIFKTLIENGVDVICCNEPLLAKKYVKYYNYKKRK